MLKVSLFNIDFRIDSFCSFSDRDGNDPRSTPSFSDLVKTSPINNVVVLLVLLQPPIAVEAAVNASNDAVRVMCFECKWVIGRLLVR
jgi:hypothetical protein